MDVRLLTDKATACCAEDETRLCERQTLVEVSGDVRQHYWRDVESADEQLPGTPEGKTIGFLEAPGETNACV